jgi:hypothetical protein
MLKSILINKKKVPVPVPIDNLPDLMAWIQDHLVHGDRTITRVQVDHEDVDWTGIGASASEGIAKVPLNESSAVECKIDSPLDISVETSDALRNLCTVFEKSIKLVAVDCWQSQAREVPDDLATMYDDLELLLELSDHLLLVLDSGIDVKTFRGLQSDLKPAVKALGYAISQHDWKVSAKILLQKIETPIRELNQELAYIQKCIFELLAEQRFHDKRRKPQMKDLSP